MKIFILLLFPLLLFSQSYSLKTFIKHAKKTNRLIKAKQLGITSKQQEVEVAKSDYWPTVDVGVSHSLISPNSLVNPGETSTVYISAAMELYDGGRKEALLKAKDFEYKASLFEKSAFEKSVTLEIVQHYFTIKKHKAMVFALQERSKELNAQIIRIKKFKQVKLSTQEEIDKLVAVYENNLYVLESVKLALVTSEENLQLISGLSAKYLKRNYFKEPRKIVFEVFENIKMLQSNASAIGENANALRAGYKPQLNLTNTYHQSHFDDTVNIAGMSGDGFLIDHQNKLMLSLNMRVFDKGKIFKQSESVKYKKLALLSEIAYAKREQKMQYKLANRSLKTSRLKLKSAKSALKATKSTYKTIRKKFEVGLVDNISFLDALTQRTLADARYKETVYDYEIRKSIYYYYAGKDPKEFIR